MRSVLTQIGRSFWSELDWKYLALDAIASIGLGSLRIFMLGVTCIDAGNVFEHFSNIDHV